MTKAPGNTMNSRDLPTADRTGPTVILPVAPVTYSESQSWLSSFHRGPEPLASRGGDKAEAPVLWTYFKARHNEPWRAV